MGSFSNQGVASVHELGCRGTLLDGVLAERRAAAVGVTTSVGRGAGLDAIGLLMTIELSAGSDGVLKTPLCEAVGIGKGTWKF